MKELWRVQARLSKDSDVMNFMVEAENIEEAIRKAERFKGIHAGIIIGAFILED